MVGSAICIVITNEKLYELTKVKPLTVRVEEARWKLFGHILRSTETTPASMSLMFAADSSSNLKGRRGRHRISLLYMLRKDLIKRNIHLKIDCIEDIYKLRELASCKSKWLTLLRSDNIDDC